MAVGVGAEGFLGFALETTPGTYVAPVIYGLLRNESITVTQDHVERRPLRGIAGVTGMLKGNVRVEGDFEVELTPAQMVQFFRAGRGSWAKVGASAPYTYTWTPSSVATLVTGRTASITVVRNAVPFGYTGCAITSATFTVDGEILVGRFSVIGQNEASVAMPTPAYITIDPYGPGEFDTEIPTATPVNNADSWELTIDDGAEAQFRLDGSRAAAFVKYGERAVSMRLERDFENRTEYDNFKNLVGESITTRAKKSANDLIQFTLPKAYKTAYPITGLSGQADLIRAAIEYIGTHDTATGKSYEIVVKTSDNITGAGIV